MRQSAGYTLVELVVVILLISITAVSVRSCYLAPSAFDGIGARDALITTARAAQQLSLGRDNVSLEIESSGNGWVFKAVSGGTTVRSTQVRGNDVSLTTGSTAAGGSCAALNVPVTVLTVDYDERGNAESLDGGPIENGVRVCINNDVTLSVCISPGGFAHAGDCES